MSWAPEGGHIWKRPADGQGQPERLTRAAGILPRSGLDPRWQAHRGPARPRQSRVERPYGSGAVLDLVWIPAQGGDATVISPARGASRSAFHPSSGSDLRDDTSGPGFDAV